MLTNKRHAEILRILEEQGSVSLQELKDRLDTSESTIRRDLTQLSEEGKLIKVFGGAISNDNLNLRDEMIGSRKILHVEEKELIGGYAASLIHDGDFVFVDAGTTTECMLRYLRNTTATYVTNAPGHAHKMCQAGLKVVLIGGMLKISTEATVGSLACDQLSAYRFNIAFMGTNGVSLHAQLSTPDPEEAMVKKMVIEHTHSCYVLADHSKFNKISPVKFADLEDVIILSDAIPEGPFSEMRNIVNVTDKLA